MRNFNFRIDVSPPYEENRTISIEQARKDFLIDDVDLDDLDKGHVIRIHDIILLKHVE